MRIIEGIIFLSLAISVHVGAFWIIPQQQNISSYDEVVIKNTTLSSASEEQISLLQAWTKTPDLFVQTHEKFSSTSNIDFAPKLNNMALQIDNSPNINAPLRIEKVLIYYSDPPKLNFNKSMPISAKTSSLYLHIPLSDNDAPNSRPYTSPEVFDRNLSILDQKLLLLDTRTRPLLQEVQSPPNFKPLPPKSLKTSNLETNNQANKKVTLAVGKFRAQWGREIYHKVSKTMRYPRYSNDSGIVTLKILIAPTGKLLNVEVINSSGSPILNEAALKAVRRAGTFAKAPKALKDESYQFQLSLNFKR